MKIKFRALCPNKIQIKNQIECFNCGKRINEKDKKCPRCNAKNEIIGDNIYAGGT